MIMQEFWENSLPTGYYDKILIAGLSNKRGIQAGWHHITFSTIKNRIRKDSKHLDYACGPGTFIGKYLSNKNSMGVDIANDQIQYANKKYSNKGKFIDLRNFDFDKHFEEFDEITVLGLMEFINENDFVELILKLQDMLKPKGKIYFTTPNFRFGMKTLDVILNVFGKIGYTDEYTSKYTKKKLNSLLKENNVLNFKILKFLNFGFIVSFFNLNLGLSLNNFIGRLFFNYFGFLLLLEIEK